MTYTTFLAHHRYGLRLFNKAIQPGYLPETLSSEIQRAIMFSFKMRRLLLVQFCVAMSMADCFREDGTKDASTDYIPCNPILGTTSMCCALNRTNEIQDNLPQDKCLPNGLCQHAHQDNHTGETFYEYWRNFCSDSTWTGCLPLKNICPVCDRGKSGQPVSNSPAYMCMRRITRAHLSA